MKTDVLTSLKNFSTLANDECREKYVKQYLFLSSKQSLGNRQQKKLGLKTDY